MATVVDCRENVNYTFDYTGFFSEVDSKANKEVTESLNLYTEEECFNHAHKRMDTALINLSKGKKIGGYGYDRLINE